MWRTLDGYTVSISGADLQCLIPRIKRWRTLWRWTVRNYAGSLRLTVARLLRALAEGAVTEGKPIVRKDRLFRRFVAPFEDQTFTMWTVRTPEGFWMPLTIRPAAPGQYEAELEDDQGETGYAADNIHAMKAIQLKNMLESKGWTVYDNRDLRKGSKKRPDLKAFKDGKWMNIEIDTNPEQSKMHQAALTSLEPGVRSLFYVIHPKTGRVLASSAYNPKPGTAAYDPKAMQWSRWYDPVSKKYKVNFGLKKKVFKPRIGKDNKKLGPPAVPLDVQQAQAVLKRHEATRKRTAKKSPQRRGAAKSGRQREFELAASV